MISALLPETNGIRTTWERLMFNMRMLLRLSSAKEFASDGLGLSRLREHCSEAYQNFEVFFEPQSIHLTKIFFFLILRGFKMH